MMMRALALCLIPAGAMAACPDLPATVSYDSGMTLTLAERDADKIRFRQTVPATGQVVEMTLRAGIFTLTALRDGAGAVFDWKTPLPATAELIPGARFRAEAILTTPGILPPRPFTSEVEVIGPERLSVAGCTYPVMKLVVQNAEGGRSLGVNTKWLHLPSLITLKSTVEEQGQTREQLALTVE